MKRVKRIMAGLFFVVLCLQQPVNIRAEEIEEPAGLYALSACLMDAESGRVLYEKEGQEERANASTTKVLTLIITLESTPLDEIVTFSEYAAKQPDVQLNAASGEQFRLEDLCYSMMLESHNDTAVAIAEHVAGNVEAFAGLMNEKARAIGCENSHFVTPNGLDKADAEGTHHTTAIDLAKILSYCITASPQKELFLTITQTPSYSFSNLAGTKTYSCLNHNAFLKMMDGALTGKTGFTGSAGYCYVGALTREGKTYVVALLGCGWPNNKTYKWADTKKLMQYGLDYFDRWEVGEVPVPQECMEPITVQNARTESLYGTDAVELLRTEDPDAPETLLLRNDQQITVLYEKETELTAPVKKGQIVGTITYLAGETCIRTDYLTIGRDVDEIDYMWRLRQILARFVL
ncbi:MAG: D-alanyl-D-alanine carboxypeptidase [Lachnospiraceae bacterium]|nr:D-alanyl-D-alanine carboxypeptidase [Lachnospiraceae bacterium]